MDYLDNIRRVTPYVPGEQPKIKNVIKLNTNENPYPPAPGVAEAIRSFDTDFLRRYPDPASGKLIAALSKAYDVPEERIFAGVGSDDVLAMCFMTFFNGKKPIRFPDITYSFYDVWAELFRIPYETVPLREDFSLAAEDYDGECGGIVIANPNAPTGVLQPLGLIEKIVSSHPECVVIVDEAYVDFGGVSALPLIEKYPNLVVVQTFSKSRNLAGLRVGYAFACEELIRFLNDVKYSFNSYTMNSVTIEAGAAALADSVYFEECCRKIVATRERSKKALEEMGFVMNPSAANFLFAKHEKVPAKVIFGELKKRGIFVRHWDKPRIADHLRITVGTDEEMEALFAALREVLKENG